MSIDLEDWFCVHNLAGVIARDDWDKCDLRVRESTTRILDLLEAAFQFGRGSHNYT